MTFDLETLSDLKLTMSEWFTLSSMVASEKDGRSLWDGDHARCDMLVLAGLVQKNDHRLHITESGRDAAEAIDQIFDWDGFCYPEEEVFLNGEPITRTEAMTEYSEPKRITVGSLVRHQHHGEGLVTDHFMWDGDWGGFRIKLLKPAQTGATTSITEFSDRADAFELVS
jgi:hypothetical protein